MNTQSNLRSVLQFLGGCLFCLGLAALGFYPFSDQKRGRNRVPAAMIRRGIKAWIA